MLFNISHRVLNSTKAFVIIVVVTTKCPVSFIFRLSRCRFLVAFQLTTRSRRRREPLQSSFAGTDIANNIYLKFNVNKYIFAVGCN